MHAPLPFWRSDLPALIKGRAAMPDPERWQSTLVRYNSQEEATAGLPAWNLACSYQCVQQLLATDPNQLSSSFTEAVAQGIAPTQLSMRIVTAPAELCGPMRTEKRLSPPFRVRVMAHFGRELDFPFTIKAYVIDNESASTINEWVPPEFRDAEPKKAPITEFKGNVCITHVFRAGAPAPAAPPGSAAAAAGRNHRSNASDEDADSSGSWGAPGAQQQGSRARSAPGSAAAGAPAWDGSAGPGGAPGASAASMGASEACCTHDFVFSDLQLAKPSRMKPFYVVFAASVLDTDLMYIVWHIPSIAICRADQMDNACKALGVPPGLGMQDAPGAAAPLPLPPPPPLPPAAPAPGVKAPPSMWQDPMAAALRQQQQQQQQPQQQTAAGQAMHKALSPVMSTTGASYAMQQQQQTDGAYATACNGQQQRQQQQQPSPPLQLQQQQHLLPTVNSSSMSTAATGPAAVPNNNSNPRFEGAAANGALLNRLIGDTVHPGAPSGGNLTAVTAVAAAVVQQQQQQLQSLLQQPGPNAQLTQQQHQQQVQGSLLRQQELLRLLQQQQQQRSGGHVGPATAPLDARGLAAVADGMLPPAASCTQPKGQPLTQQQQHQWVPPLLPQQQQQVGSPQRAGARPPLPPGPQERQLGLAWSQPNPPLDAAVAKELLQGMKPLPPQQQPPQQPHSQPQAQQQQQPWHHQLQRQPPDPGSKHSPEDPAHAMQQPSPPTSSAGGAEAGASAAAAAAMCSVPRPPSRAALRALLLQSYRQLGFVRQLSELDLLHLEGLAGFGAGAGGGGGGGGAAAGAAGDADPMAVAALGAAVVQPEWEYFLGNWVQMLSLLRLIHRLWDFQQPATAVAGLHLSRSAVVSLLRGQPPGTFICRVSFSQPGSLIVSCRLPETHSQADGDGMVHMTVAAAQLRQRRADGWLRSLQGATHLLDVYTLSRLDKRQLLESDYMAVKSLAPAAGGMAGAGGGGGGVAGGGVGGGGVEGGAAARALLENQLQRLQAAQQKVQQQLHAAQQQALLQQLQEQH